jgi:glutathione-specific gamma-glutamylcyclotransferase
VAISKRTLQLTAELVALAERTEPDPGPEPGCEELSADDYEAWATQLLQEYAPERLFVFAYGSLIWNPEFEVVSQRPATVSGWHRSFCLKLTRWRGTRELPALMLALDRGGTCNGVLFEVAGRDHKAQLLKLLERELDAKAATNIPKWVVVKSGSESVRALTFVADRNGPAYSGKCDLAHVAGVLSRAAGHWGSAAIYLQKTVAQLEDHGIRDRNLWTLQSMVADLIKHRLEGRSPPGRSDGAPN